jgi:hypothetical protein
MTAPAETTETLGSDAQQGAPAAPDAPPAAPAEKPAPKTLEESLAGLDDATKAFVLGEVAAARKEAAAARTNAKTKAAEDARNELTKTVAQALGLEPADTPVDPAELTKQIESERSSAAEARRELAVFHAAGDADPAKLLDSRSFMKSIADVDPSDSQAITAAIAQAVAGNPGLKRGNTPRVPAPNPGQDANGVKLTPAQAIEAAEKAGDHKLAGALKAAQLVALQSAQAQAQAQQQI